MKNIKKFMSALSLIVMAFVCAFAFTGCGATDEFARADAATIEEVSEYIDERTEVGLGNGFDMTLKTNTNFLGMKLTINARIKILFEGTTVSKAVCIMSMSGDGGSIKVYAYVKDSKVYTHTVGKEAGQKIDTKYVNNFNGDFGLGRYDLQDFKDTIQDSINQVVSTLTTSPAEVLELMGIKKIIDEENESARFQIKGDYVTTDSETGESTKLGTYTFVLGFKGNDLVEISASTKMSGVGAAATTIKTITEISDKEYPSETELSRYVSGTLTL